mmetsp:Transcript_97446/g.254093  ORF Transcript_97446/g.254093 Transcript_97446/m.254093 type:complete len:323 (+) Transcript_97446:109-1077(+)
MALGQLAWVGPPPLSGLAAPPLAALRHAPAPSRAIARQRGADLSSAVAEAGAPSRGGRGGGATLALAAGAAAAVSRMLAPGAPRAGACAGQAARGRRRWRSRLSASLGPSRKPTTDAAGRLEQPNSATSKPWATKVEAAKSDDEVSEDAAAGRPGQPQTATSTPRKTKVEAATSNDEVSEVAAVRRSGRPTKTPLKTLVEAAALVGEPNFVRWKDTFAWQKKMTWFKEHEVAVQEFIEKGTKLRTDKRRLNTIMTRQKWINLPVVDAEFLKTPMELKPQVFSTGSCGFWGASKITMDLGGQEVTMQCQVSCTITGSKEWPES